MAESWWMSPTELVARLNYGLDRIPTRSSWVESYAYDDERQILYVWLWQVKGGVPQGSILFCYPDVPIQKGLELATGETNSKGVWMYYNAISTGQLKNYVKVGGIDGTIGTYVPNTKKAANP